MVLGDRPTKMAFWDSPYNEVTEEKITLSLIYR